MKPHIGWGGERNLFYKGMETSSYQTRFNNFEGKLERKNLKRTIFVSGEFWLLHEIKKKIHVSNIDST